MFVDTILVFLLIISIIYGCKKGVIKIVAVIGSTLIAFGLAYVLAGNVGSFIKNDTKIGIDLKTSIESNIVNVINEKTSSEDFQVINKLISKINLFINSNRFWIISIKSGVSTKEGIGFLFLLLALLLFKLFSGK